MKNSLLKKTISCLIEQLYQIECADDDQINEDFSIKLMEVVGADLQTLNSDDISEFTQIILEFAGSEQNGDRREYLENFSENFGLDSETI